MASYNKCTKCSQNKEKNFLCLNERCGRSRMFDQICIQCHRLQHRDSNQKVTEDDIDIVLGTIRSSAEQNLKQVAVRILDKGMIDTINHLLNNINEVIESLESIKTVFNRIIELSNSSHIEYQNIIKRIDSITSRKDEDAHIARQLKLIQDKIIYNPEGKVQFIHETNKMLIKQNSSSFTNHCKKSIEKINATIQEIFQFDTLILDTFVKKKGSSDTEDLSDLEKLQPPTEQQGEELIQQSERQNIAAEIESLKAGALGNINELMTEMLSKPFAYDSFEEIKIMNDSGIRIEKGLEIVKHVEEGEKNWEIASKIYDSYHQCILKAQELNEKLNQL